MGQKGVGSKSNVPVYKRRPDKAGMEGRDRYSSERRQSLILKSKRMI